MFNFNLKTVAIFTTVRFEKYPAFRFAKTLKTLFFILFIAVILFYVFIFLAANISFKIGFDLNVFKLFYFSTLFLEIFFVFFILDLFFNSKLKNPKIGPKLNDLNNPEQYNLADFLSFEAAKIINRAEKLSRGNQINSYHLFYSFLLFSPQMNFIIFRLVLNFEEIKKIIKEELEKQESRGPENSERFSSDFQNTILESFKISREKEEEKIKEGRIILGLAKNNYCFKKILIDSNFKLEDIENLIWWFESLEKKNEENKKFWEWKNLQKWGSLGKDWASGYTINLDKFSEDISFRVKKQLFPEIIGHNKEVEEAERILSKTQFKNILMVGEPGSGRKSIVEKLTERIALGESMPLLNYQRIIRLDLARLFSQAASFDEAESLLDAIFQEAIRAGNIILVIDEFHNYIGGKVLLGSIDISGILGKYLHLPEFQIIAITTFEGLHRNIEQNPSILSLFEKVEVSEISQKETLFILENLSSVLEKKHKIFISYPALRDIINFSEKYLADVSFPEKAISLLDEVVVSALQEKQKIILSPKVAKIISEKIQVPVGEIEEKEKDVLLNLENLIHQRIINQEEAVKEVSSAMRRARAEISVRKGPMGGFLFLGPTGVGKTETSKALAQIYFGSEERMIRLDMSEFQNVQDIPRLIGSNQEPGLLTTKVRENPFSLILLDEIEKAHPNILNLFLQVLDEGHLTDGLGRKIDFKNSIIIATSNAGAEIIWKDIEADTKLDLIKNKLFSFLFEKGIFRPEFINRFDAVVLFKPLTRENLVFIAELLLQKIKKGLSDKSIEFLITQPLKEKIVELSYNPAFGAREMQRVIQDKIGNVLATAILSGKIKRGDRVEINSGDFGLLINP